MQLQVICKLACISMVIFIFSSCSKPNTQGKLIPINASVVIQVDGKSLSSKLSWDEIKQNPLFKEMDADSSWPATVKNLLDNPDNAGIDTKADLLFFVLKDSAGGYVGFEGNVKDEATFKKFNQQITENGAASEKDGVETIIPLVADFEIVTLPSASTLKLLRQESGNRKQVTRSVAVLADPVFEGSDPRVAASLARPNPTGDGTTVSLRDATHARQNRRAAMNAQAHSQSSRTGDARLCSQYQPSRTICLPVCRAATGRKANR